MADFPAFIDLSTLDGVNGFRLDGIDPYDRSGRSVASAGDVNGDGFDDVIVGAPNGDPNGVGYAGESYVVFGSDAGFASLDLSTLDGTNGFRLDGIDPGDQSGFSVASAGDVNGDGFDDVIVGARFADPNGDSAAGESYVVFGSDAGLASLDLSTLDGTNGFRLDGIDPQDFSGFPVASAGDVNGDGFDDVVLGAHLADPEGGASAGESYVVFGSGAGFAAAIDLASLDGTNGFRLDGIDPSDRSGLSVASAGDVNGDGLGDLIVGAPFADPNGDSDAGESYVVFGSDAGFTSLDLSTLDGSNGFRLDGIDPQDRSGRSVASAGDVNGDGFDDVIVGAYRGDPNGDSDAGESYVVFGSDAGFASLDLATLDGTNGFRIDGIDTEDQSGYSVASAGDVNGDGFDDIVIGAFPADSFAGESYVVFGSGAGFAAAIDLASLDGSNGFRLDGADPFDQSGSSVASAGDVNDDGFDDVIVGADRADPNGDSAAGESYVVFGRAPEEDVRRAGTQAAQKISGGRGDDTLEGLGGGDTLRGNGGDDALDGGSGDDRIEGGDGIDRVTAGSGDDTVLGGAGSDEALLGSGDDSADGGAGADTLRGEDGADILIGGLGGDLIDGGEADDILNGKEGDDSLAGAGGDDILRGTAGEDTMIGGDGDDMYFVDTAGDVVIESAGDGTDMVIARADFSAGANEIELIRAKGGVGLALTGGDNATRIRGGAGADTLTGGAAGDVITGAGGDDRIVASGGNDFTRGGGGADSFVLNSDANGADRVRIADFTSGTDAIELDADDFAGLTPGALDPDAFVVNRTGLAEDAEDRLIYNDFSGALSFDADGTGEGEAIDIARLMRGPELDAGDFLVTGSAAEAPLAAMLERSGSWSGGSLACEARAFDLLIV